MKGVTRRAAFAAAVICGVLAASGVSAQEKHYKFAYDQPKTTAYGIAGDIFAAKLKELSKGQMIIDQYPGGQLGQEPQALQLLRSGDIDFSITSSANTATLSPQAGVMSLHFLFKSEDHLARAIADPRLSEAVHAMIAETVTGARMIGLATSGLRSMYAKKEIKTVDDVKGLKVRVQATATEDAIFPAYGAQTVHMPFGSVYTSIQTGVVDAADYVMWRKIDGGPGSYANDWYPNFGVSYGGAGNSGTIPEPASTALVLIAAGMVSVVARRRH